MKTNRIIQLAAGVLLLTACTSDFYEEYVNGRVPVSLGYEVLTAEESTRTAASTDLNDANIASGDNITVKIKNNGADASAYTSYTYTAGASGAMTPPSPKPYYPTGSTNIDILAYYPANAASNFDVSADQTTDANYKTSDLMVATVTNQAKTTSTVALAFQHKMAKLVVTATKDDGVNTIQTITLKNVKRRVTFTNTTGEVGTATSISGTDVVLFKDGSAATGTGAALIPAQTIEGDVLEIVTDQGTAVYNVPTGKAFSANTKYTISVTVNRTAVGATNTITWGSSASLTIQPTVTKLRAVITPEGAIPGLFTINADGDQVFFSQGNLQYDGTNWKFATNQYDVLGADGTRANGDATGYPMDLFTWGNIDNPTYNENTYTNGTDNLSGTTDWGSNAISNGGNTANSGWRTLSGAEWTYLFETRTNAASKFGYATVAGKEGIIIVPDDFTDPNKNNGSGAFVGSTTTGWTANVYSAENWSAMETSGCVFLPAAGQRYGTSVYSVGSEGYYWSSTANGTGNAYYVYFYSGGVYPALSNPRNFGFSVRLVRRAWYKEVSSATSSDIGKIICSNGHIHTNVNDVTCGGSASAIIVYVGSATGNSTYNHGLALALYDANGGNASTNGSYCAWGNNTSSTVNGSGYQWRSSSSFGVEDGSRYGTSSNKNAMSRNNSTNYPAFYYCMNYSGGTAPTNSTGWFLPSAYQWNQMVSAVGSYSNLRDYFSSRGGRNMQSDLYWSCTEYSTGYAWNLRFRGGNWNTGGKTYNYYVRSALAF